MQILKRIYRKLKRTKNNLSISLFGHYSFQKFVIISRSRTGSTLLMALLRSHPNVHIEGEVFKKLNGKSCQQIWNELYSKKPNRIKQVGFKLFYYHPFDEDKEVWEFLTNDKSISIIHLRRLNLLRAFASQKIGEKTKKWTQHISDSQKHDKTITLDPAECAATFKTITEYEDNAREQFKGHINYIECSYEEMDANNQDFIAKLYGKLGLKPHIASTVLKKQNPESLQDLIVNYNELEQEFKDTKWNYLFSETNNL